MPPWNGLLDRLRAKAYARRPPLVLVNGLAEQPESWFRNRRFWGRYFDVHAPNILAYVFTIGFGAVLLLLVPATVGAIGIAGVLAAIAGVLAVLVGIAVVLGGRPSVRPRRSASHPSDTRTTPSPSSE